jgi:tetratricopeptide (TPR) repeat protein
VLAAVIAAQVGDVSLQRERLQRVLERNPYNWYAYLELGLIEARRGRRTQALDWIDRAAALNPLEETIAFARSRVDGGSPPSQAEMDAFIRRTAEPLTGETG